MPVVLRIGSFRFFFYSNEGDPRQPVHVHVRRGSAVARFWLHPEVRLADGYGFDARTCNQLAWRLIAPRSSPRLLRATPEQRARVEVSGGGSGLHWDELDEDISVAGLLAGRPNRAARVRTAA